MQIKKYWDITFHPETKDRILQCNKISIAFPKLQNYAKFWKKCENNNITIIYNNDYKMIIKEYPELQIYIGQLAQKYENTFKYLKSLDFLTKDHFLYIDKPWINYQKKHEFLQNHLHDEVLFNPNSAASFCHNQFWAVCGH